MSALTFDFECKLLTHMLCESSRCLSDSKLDKVRVNYLLHCSSREWHELPRSEGLSFRADSQSVSSACVFSVSVFNPLIPWFISCPFFALSLFSFFVHVCSWPDLGCLIVYSLVLALRRGEITRQLPQGLTRFEIYRPQARELQMGVS